MAAKKIIIIISVLVLSVLVFSSIAIDHPYNLKDHKICYAVCYAHLDTQWQWNLATTILQCIPNTLHRNFTLFELYPEYVFSFEGAYRYWLAKEFYPAAYDTLKQYVSSGRWTPAGSVWEACDVIVPSPESLIRQILYGNGYFQREFGKTSIDILLPDSHGFPWSLPTIAVHCGLIGFSTNKFDNWGGWTNTPFPIGIWEGVDGSEIIAVLKFHTMGLGFSIPSSDGDWLKANSQNNGSPGVWATVKYKSTGDMGGAPSASSVADMCARIRQNDSLDIKVVNASSDQMFRDFLEYPQLIDGLPRYNNELVMRTHGVGCYTSWSRLKLENRQNEQRAAAAEHASLMANLIDNTPYPAEKITHAWLRFLQHQDHHDLTGTSIPSVYSEYTLPALDSSMREFTGVMEDANSRIAGVLDTRVSSPNRMPVVVYNPLCIARKDIVEATLAWTGALPSSIQVFGRDGKEVPSQIIGTSGSNLSIAFVAEMPPMGYKVYEISPTASSLQTELIISTSILENANYKVTVDERGDISSIFNKKINGELLAEPSRFEMRDDRGTTFPAWEITYNNCTASPREYVDANVQKTVIENGPARISLKVTRSKAGSDFIQYIRLGAGDAGSYVEVFNEISWNSPGSLLKVAFPLTCSNDSAAFDLGIGAINRPNLSTSRYEVPAHQWADLTHNDNSYGVSIINDCKYGWNKAADNRLNLTLIHSPSGGGYNYQGDLTPVINWIHRFTYGIYGHAGTWQHSNVVHEAERMNQPLIAFQAEPHEGKYGKKISFLTIENSEQLSVMGLKKAELSDKYILRVREIRGEPISNAKISFISSVLNAVDVTGQEEVITPQSILPRVKPKPVQASGNHLIFDCNPFQIRAFAFELDKTVGIGSDTYTSSFVSPKVLITNNQQSITFYITTDQKIRKVVITDMAGRTVQVLQKDLFKQKVARYRWDRKGTNGAPASSGVYVVHVATEKERFSKKFLLVR